MSDLTPSPNENSFSPIPTQPDHEWGEGSDLGMMQTLFQENLSLREQIARHAQLMQLLTHQLATPLTSLSGSVHLLGDVELDPEHRQEFLGLIEQQIHRLQDLLKDLMALRDLETGVLENHPVSFSVPDLVAEVVADFTTYPVQYAIQADLPPVWGDRWQISQVLVNLLSNAIKYSPNGQPIEVGAALHPSNGVEIWVKDQGLGIPEADQPYLFERFYRVKHHDRQGIDGTGLGLSLCKLLVENQGGQLGFESTHGQGSRFHFTLPIAASVHR